MSHRRSSVLDVNEWMRKAEGLLAKIRKLIALNDSMDAGEIGFPQHNTEITNGVHELGFRDVFHFCDSFPAKFIIDRTTGIITLGEEKSSPEPERKEEDTPEIVSLSTASSSSIHTSSSRSMLQQADIDDETITLLSKYNPIPPSLRSPRRKEEMQKIESVKQTECIHFKYSHEGKTRRFVVPRDFSYIIGAVKDRVENITGKKDLLLYWRDDESLIVLECGEDMQAAIDFAESQMKPPTCIVIETTGEVEEKEEQVTEVVVENSEKQQQGSATQDVVPATTSTDSDVKSVSEEESRAAFNDIAFICDECDAFLAPSNGGRYKCMVCVNYDLCKNCVEKSAHFNHALVRLLNAETLVPIGEKGGRLVKVGETQGCAPSFVAKTSEKPIDPTKIFEAVREIQKMEVETTKKAVKLEDLRKRKRVNLEKKIEKVKTKKNIQSNLEKEMSKLAKSMAVSERMKQYDGFLSTADPEYIEEFRSLLESDDLEFADVKASDLNDYEDEERELQEAIRESEKEARREEKKRKEEERLDQERAHMRRIDEEREEQRRVRAEKQWKEMKRTFEPRIDYWTEPPRYVRHEPVDFYDLRNNTEEDTDSDLSLIRDEEVLPESIYKAAAHTLVAPPSAVASDENKQPESKSWERRRMATDPYVPIWDWEESSIPEKREERRRTSEEKQGSVEKETSKIQWPSELWRSTTSIGNGAHSAKFLKDREDFLTGVDEIDNIPVHLEQILLWEMLYDCAEEALPEKLDRFCSLVNCSAQMNVYQKPEKIFTGNGDVENEMIRLIAVELAARLQTMKESVGFAIPKIRSKVIASRLGELDERIRKERDMNNKYRHAAMQIRPIICNCELLSRSMIINEGTTYKKLEEQKQNESSDQTSDVPVNAPVEKQKPLSRNDSTDGSDIEIIDMLREGSSSSLDKFDLMEAQFVKMLLQPSNRAAAAAAASPPYTPAAEPVEPTTPSTTPAEVQSDEPENEPAVEPEIDQQQSSELFSLLKEASAALALENHEVEPSQNEQPTVSPTWPAADRATLKRAAAAAAQPTTAPTQEILRDLFESCIDHRIRKSAEQQRSVMDRESVMEEATWRRLSRPLPHVETPEVAAVDDDDDSPFFSCSEEDPVREAWMDLQATVTTLRLRREKEEAKAISDDVKHIPVCMEYNILLELHDMDNIHEMQARMGVYCGQVSKNSKMEFKEHKTIFSEHKDIENMIIKQIAADLSKRLKNMKKIVDYASPPTRRRMILNRVCELRAQIKEFKYNRVLFQSVCSELHIILLTNEFTVSYNPMESLDRGWKYLYDHAKGFVDTAKANAPTLGQLLHPSQQQEQSVGSSTDNAPTAAWNPWEEEFPTEPTAPATPTTPAVVPSAPVFNGSDDGFIPLVDDVPSTDEERELLIPLAIPVELPPMTEQQQILLAELFETGIFEDYERMTKVCRKAKNLEQAVEMMLE